MSSTADGRDGGPGTIRLAILNDYEIVVLGLADLLGAHEDFEIVEISTEDTVDSDVDVALYDTFGSVDDELDLVTSMVGDAHVGSVVVFTWEFDQVMIDRALSAGATGVLSKSLTADDLVDSIRRIHAGEVVVSDHPARTGAATARRWPGQSMNLTEKEADVLALIVRGLDNRSIAETLYISGNTVKSRIRNLYRKIGVETRVNAALWGVKHGFEPDNEVAWSDVEWRG